MAWVVLGVAAVVIPLDVRSRIRMHVFGGRMSRMASPALLFRLRRVVDEQRIQGRENKQGGGLTSQEPAQDGPASGAFASLPRSSTEQGRFSARSVDPIAKVRESIPGWKGC